MTSKVERHADQLHALGHTVRLTILRILVQGGPAGVSAGDIQTRLEIPASTLSHHLSRLMTAKLITTRGEGTYHYYAADIEALHMLTSYVWEDCCNGGTRRC